MSRRFDAGPRFRLAWRSCLQPAGFAVRLRLARARLAGTVIVCLVGVVAPAQAATTSRVSVGLGGAQAVVAGRATLSGNGGYVAFAARDLVAPPDGGGWGIYGRDLAAAVTSRVSVDIDGGGADGPSGNADRPVASADGRFVAFSSEASNLVAGDTNGVADVFLRDRATGVTRRVSVASDGAPGDGRSYAPSISADGSVIAFTSAATNLVGDDTNLTDDVFVRHLATGVTERVSVDSAGGQVPWQGNANNSSSYSSPGSLSADGLHVAFVSVGANLAWPYRPDPRFHRDAYVRDLATGMTERVNLTTDGQLANYSVSQVAISGTGRQIAFDCGGAGGCNLSPDHTFTGSVIYLRDRITATTQAVSRASSGALPPAFASDPALSSDGRWLAFAAEGVTSGSDPALVDDDTNGVRDVYLRDLQSGTTVRVSVAADGSQSNAVSFAPDVDDDGAKVSFTSQATNLVAGDTNGREDVFVRVLRESDVTPPSITAAATNADGSPYLAGTWTNQTVTVRFTCSDTGSGIASCPADQAFAADGITLAASGTAADRAGNTATASFGPIQVDKTPPTVNVTGVSDGASYVLGAPVPAPGCAADDGTGAGIATSPAVSVTPPGGGVGVFTATCGGASDLAGNAASPVSATYKVLYATGTCGGAPGHAILQPINAAGTSVFKKGSTVPAKFRLCDASGNPVSDAVVASFRLVRTTSGTTVADVNEAVYSTTPDTNFRWDPSAQQWIFNINTKNLASSTTYAYRITLNDTTTIEFQFGLRP